MVEEQLRKAYALMKQGQTKESLAVVQSVLKQDKNNVAAWWLMTNLLVDDPERQKKALEKVLSLDPKHKLALQLQAKMNGSPAPKASPNPQAAQTNAKSQAAQAAQATGKTTAEIEFDWAKLEAKEAGKKESDTSADSRLIRTASFLMLGIALLFVTGLGIFYGIPAFQFSQINNPHDTILRFYNATFKGDMRTARTLVCVDAQANFDTIEGLILAELDTMKAEFGEGATISFDFSGLTAEVVSNDGTNAVVRVAGQYALSSPEVAEPLITEVVATEENLDMLRLDNGVWCVAKIPLATDS